METVDPAELKGIADGLTNDASIKESEQSEHC